ncbi:hypothetical protein EXM65_06590 [Clostridium botulinum]|uniref:Uncharacterized protein n=1 Tax=Clostridium botulinum TaxID=1491 RepID=A0A6M0SPD1_CLOBO|nr:hypothetical protein [Clostridium botulinum]
MKDIVYIAIISFIVGCFITFILTKKLSLKKLLDAITTIKYKSIRFLRHTISLTGVFVVILITYFILDKFNYGEQILPNIISTGLSILIIDFLLKERELSQRQKEKEKVKLLIDDRINRIIRNIKGIILKFINLEQLEDVKVSKEIIKGIIQKQDLVKEKVTHTLIKEDGEVDELEISKMDFTYYVGKELEKDVDDLLINFNQFLDSNQIYFLVTMKETLSKKIFKIRCSTLYTDFEMDEYKVIENLLIDTLGELNVSLENREAKKW